MRALAWLAIAAAGLLVPAASHGGGDGRRALVVGDSLAVGTRPYLPELLPRWTLVQHVRVGTRTADGVTRVRALGARLPAHVVISLGTNDDPRRIAAFRHSVRAVLDAAGPRRCVVWPTIARPPVRGASYAGFNDVLASEARVHRRLRIVDWAAMTRGHAAWLRRDRVHATAAGYRARAAAIALALARCAA